MNLTIDFHMDSNPNKQKREGKSTKKHKKKHKRQKQVEIDTTPSNTGVKNIRQIIIICTGFFYIQISN